MHAGVAIVGAALLVGGCTKHGTHTGPFKEQAIARMNQVKAATTFDLANQQFLAGDLQKALNNVEQSISLHDKVSKSHVLHGRVLIELGRLEAARQAFARAIEVEAACTDAHYYTGVINERLSQFDKALTCYRQAIDSDPSNPQFIIAAAEMLIDLGRFDEADSLLNDPALVEPHQHNAGLHQTRGHLALLRGSVDDAVRYFGEASLLAPDDASILEDQARAFYSLERYAEAEAVLRRLLTMPGTEGSDEQVGSVTPASRADLRHLHAKCFLRLDQPVEARRILVDLVREPAPSVDAAIWTDLGSAALMLKDGARLREVGQRLMALRPNHADGYMFTAMWQRDAGRPADAVKTLDRAIARTRGPMPGLLRGMILADLGRVDEARASFQTVLNQHPDNVEAQRLLSSVGAASEATGLAGVGVED